MTNREVIDKFLVGEPGRALNLYSTGERLFSYFTCIAQYTREGLIVNKTKYSVTTTKHLNILLAQVTPDFVVRNIAKNSDRLL